MSQTPSTLAAPTVALSALYTGSPRSHPAHQAQPLLSCCPCIPSSLHSTWQIAQGLLAEGKRKGVPYKCLSLCKVNPTRGGHLWPMDTGRPQARISPVFSGGSGSDNSRLAWPVLTLALGVLPPYPSPLGSRSWAISFPHPNRPSQPGPPHGRACSKSPDFSREHLTTGAGITQAKDPGDCVSSRDLGAEPGDRRRGSAGLQPAHIPQASSPERGRRPHSGLSSAQSNRAPGLEALPMRCPVNHDPGLLTSKPHPLCNRTDQPHRPQRSWSEGSQVWP